METSHARPANSVTSRAIAATLPGISGVASMVASSPLKKAVSPPAGWEEPSMMTRPMSMPSRGCLVMPVIVVSMSSRMTATTVNENYLFATYL